MQDPLCDWTHPLLGERGIEHGFGTRGSRPPEGLFLPKQVHSSFVASWIHAEQRPGPDKVADAAVTADPGSAVGVVTADCVPILVATENGAAVGAIHAGWRGFASGVVDEGLKALRRIASGQNLYAVVGPHIGACCYEVDDPVVEALRPGFGSSLSETLESSRPGHYQLDLGALAALALARGLISPTRQGRFRDGCTRCHPEHFHSHRRDAEAAGRMTHWVRAAAG